MSRQPVDVSVVMPVHAGVDPEHLAGALASVIDQTVMPREIIVVLDGPVGPSHEVALASAPGLTIVALPRNLGSGPARAAGVARCRTTWVAMADADDLNEPDRLEVQLDLLAADGADVCSAAMAEFSGTPDTVVGLRVGPTEHADFVRLMPRRNPVNQPAVMFRRELAESVGGYQDVPFYEDYDLWARLLVAGARFTGTSTPLVRFRSGPALGRRSHAGARRGEVLMQQRLQRYGVINRRRRVINVVVRGTFQRLPAPVMRLAYRRLFVTPIRPWARVRRHADIAIRAK